jgi:hypothetical protein
LWYYSCLVTKLGPSFCLEPSARPIWDSMKKASFRVQIAPFRPESLPFFISSINSLASVSRQAFIYVTECRRGWVHTRQDYSRNLCVRFEWLADDLVPTGGGTGRRIGHFCRNVLGVLRRVSTRTNLMLKVT